MTRIAFVADNSCGLPPEIAREHGSRVAPIDVIIDSKIRPGVSSSELIAALESGHKVTTSRPSPPAFLEIYQQLRGEGFDSIIAVTLSSTLSGTYESALIASREMDIPIRVIDSRNVGLGFGLAVLDAARRMNPTDLDAMVQSIVNQSAETAVYFYLESLEYLRRGGRIGTTSALLGTALSVKPILQLSNGEIVPCTKVRTQAKALARLVELALESCRPNVEYQFGVQHLGAHKQAEHCADLLRAEHPEAEILMSEVTAVVGAHAGPGLVAVIASPLIGNY
jgi:DegV family protein with EDD domain